MKKGIIHTLATLDAGIVCREKMLILRAFPCTTIRNGQPCLHIFAQAHAFRQLITPYVTRIAAHDDEPKDRLGIHRPKSIIRLKRAQKLLASQRFGWLRVPGLPPGRSGLIAKVGQ